MITSAIPALNSLLLVNSKADHVISLKSMAERVSLSFSDVNFKSTYGAFKIKSLDNSCFKAKAIPKSKSKTWFQIDYNSETGEVSKSCGDSSKYGCSKGNTW